MTDWTTESNITTDWFGNVLAPPEEGLRLEEIDFSLLLREDGSSLELEDG